MAVFRDPSVSVAVRLHGMGAELRKSGDHIQNSVEGVASILLMLYLPENRNFICVVKIRLLESNLLGV